MIIKLHTYTDTHMHINMYCQVQIGFYYQGVANRLRKASPDTVTDIMTGCLLEFFSGL